MSGKKFRLSDGYTRWLEVIAADTPVSREKAYRLRYQIYCCEHQFETPDEHRHQLETDAFDCRSIHSLAIDRASGDAIGTVRLILPDQDYPEASFPIQHICKHPLPVPPPMSGAAEISRFAVSKQLRNMADENCPKEFKFSIAMSLMRAIVQRSMECGITDWFAIMEPSLLRLLGRFGIYFNPIGPLVEYHGIRQPCHSDSDTLLGRVRREHYDLWEFLTESSGTKMTEIAAIANF
jgi:N-acyl amino acid synthase of PEP-CTERM/exosortase system